MPITIKKQQTVKTIKVAPPPPTARVQAQPESAASANAAESSPHVSAPAIAPAAVTPAGSYTWAVIVALIAVLVCIAIIGLQAWELNFYYQPEPAFPRTVAATPTTR